MSGASERANGGASGPVLQSVLLAVFDHSVDVNKGSFITQNRSMIVIQRDEESQILVNMQIISQAQVQSESNRSSALRKLPVKRKVKT